MKHRLSQSYTSHWSFDRRLTDTTHLFHFLQSFSQSLLSVATVYPALSLSLYLCCYTNSTLLQSVCCLLLSTAHRFWALEDVLIHSSDAWIVGSNPTRCVDVCLSTGSHIHPVTAETLWLPSTTSSTYLWTDAQVQKIENWTVLTCNSNRQCTEEEEEEV